MVEDEMDKLDEMFMDEMFMAKFSSCVNKDGDQTKSF